MQSLSGVASADVKYSRTTELRLVADKDVFKLAAILDDNGCWRKLMEIIPKRLDAQKCSAPGALNYTAVVAEVGLKYSNDDIRLVENEYKRGRYDRVSQILIDEWKTSGKRNERPTLGLLLQLLTQAELYRAADFVAEQLLKEPKPLRPSDGPAACIELASELCEDMDVDFDSTFYPSTAALNNIARYQPSEGFNRDFDTKYVTINKHMPKLQSHSQPTRATLVAQHIAHGDAAAASFSDNCNSFYGSESEVSEPNIPNLSGLVTNVVNAAADLQSRNFSAVSLQNGESGSVSKAPIPLLSLLLDDEVSAPAAAVRPGGQPNEPRQAQAMLNGHKLSNGSNESEEYSSSSLSNDDDDNHDGSAKMSVAKNSNTEQLHSSNTNSSLTNVTGTSGENSFELTNDSSLGSGGNIPNLSCFQK